MRKIFVLLCSAIFIFGTAASSSAFLVDFEDGSNGAAINDIEGVSFKNFSGYDAMYGDSRTGRYETTSDDLGTSYNSGVFHHRGNFWLWAGKAADARGVIVDFTNNNGTWFKTGYSSYGSFIVEAHLTNGSSVRESGPTNIGSGMGYLRVSASAGSYIDYVVLKGAEGNAWLVDDMSGDTTGVASEPEPEPPGPNSDDDKDGMPHAWEIANGLNPNANDAASDPDLDGLSNIDEYRRGTNPKNGDTDADAIPDGWEVANGLNPLVNDAASDSDRDGLSNIDEYRRGTNPVNGDTDADGMPDGWEVTHGLNPRGNDALADADSDGLPNLNEYQRGTNPGIWDTDTDGMPDGWETVYGLNPLGDDADGDADGDFVSNLDEYRAGTNPIVIPGEFTVGESGSVGIDWLYDGGMFEGEFGIFSSSGMEAFLSNPEAFITEAVTRTLSNSAEGYVVFSDSDEAAYFSGPLGGESQDWNMGEYKEIKYFSMRPGDTFAMILVPDSTLEQLAKNPMTTDAAKRPLFSIALSNLDYGMHVGQMADITGYGSAFAFEDMDFERGDKDYNDLIVHINGAVAEVPLLDAVLAMYADDGGKHRRNKRDNTPVLFREEPLTASDWRYEEELGRQIMAHLEASSVQPETLWMSVTFDGPADLFVYAPDGKEIGKEGRHIPGASLGKDGNQAQTVSLPALGPGTYRIVLRATGDGGLCNLTVRGHQGQMAVLSEMTETFQIGAHQVLRSEVSASELFENRTITLETPHTPATPGGEMLFYDFDGNGKIDAADIKKVSSKWNLSQDDPEYDAFYDLDDDGYIGILDIMPVAGGNSAQP